MLVDINACKDISDCSFTYSEFSPNEAAWNHRIVSKVIHSDDRVIQLMGRRGEGNISGGYTEKDGFYVDGTFK